MCAAHHDSHCDDGRYVQTLGPRVLPRVDLIDHVVEFLREVVRRRSAYELRKAEMRT
jgi:DNA gyrase/topoisomerase IV subunit A